MAKKVKFNGKAKSSAKSGGKKQTGGKGSNKPKDNAWRAYVSAPIPD